MDRVLNRRYHRRLYREAIHGWLPPVASSPGATWLWMIKSCFSFPAKLLLRYSMTPLAETCGPAHAFRAGGSAQHFQADSEKLPAVVVHA
jgi:hypothetical protein